MLGYTQVSNEQFLRVLRRVQDNVLFYSKVVFSAYIYVRAKHIHVSDPMHVFVVAIGSLVYFLLL